MFGWREQRDSPTDADPGAAAATVDWGFTAASVPSAVGQPVGQTNSAAGASRGEFAGFNLGLHVGDDPAAVEVNRRQLADAFGVSRSHLLFLNQEHGANVVVAGDDAPWQTAPVADAVVTTRSDVALVALVADCTAVLLADRVAGVVGAVHAGRPGLITGVVPAALAAMRDLGATSIEAAVGPSVCARCYEVPEAMRAEAAAVSPVSASVSWTGTPSIDIAAGVVDQLATAGVAVTWLPGCTRESEGLYSYRRSQTTGRFAGVVRLWS